MLTSSHGFPVVQHAACICTTRINSIPNTLLSAAVDCRVSVISLHSRTPSVPCSSASVLTERIMTPHLPRPGAWQHAAMFSKRYTVCSTGMITSCEKHRYATL
ncbi:hypothetical protein BC831DRAFT_5252 [Entophlyctis helioformis]|nr:hypothetical protein BC831DRAFT_5252 [Entophlyctis helioformis]